FFFYTTILTQYSTISLHDALPIYIYETRVLTEAARKYKVVTQMGNQGASNPAQEQMKDWFNKGLIGNVHEAHIWTNRPVWPQGRSEEHTSELQSRENLVCRLLLEK